ncbi:hypothetical protein ACPWSR_06160 [Alloiococcus sp. CFN-8]|uniref:hypothetical protein n=1 Tax=Alloiococcus sp. CFN-8 TaxID=3416081 RepID=UPI003CF6D14C
MRTKIAVITTSYLREFIEKVLNEINMDCDFKVIEYKNFKNISETYYSLEDEVDGYMVSGNVAHSTIDKTINKHKKPMMWFGTDLLSLYRIFIGLFLDNRNMDINRVIMDFLIPIRENPTCTEILENKNLDSVKRDLKRWRKNSSVDTLYTIEKDISEKIIKLWKDKKIDLVICTYSSIVPILKENNISYIFAKPEAEHIKETVSRLLASIKLNKMRENIPVVISVSQKGERNIEDSDLDTVSLQKCLLDFNKENVADFLVQRSNDGFDIYTSLRVTNIITNFLEGCKLSLYLEEHLPFKVSIGYGIGNNIVEAKNNAAEAKKEALLMGGTFIMDEKYNLIGPLNTEHSLVIRSDVSPEIQEIAEKSRLSTLTIQKLASILKMMGTDLLTTNDLAAKLNATVRNANRILSNLERGGYAVVLYNKASSSKGRPTKIYKITLPFNSK